MWWGTRTVTSKLNKFEHIWGGDVGDWALYRIPPVNRMNLFLYLLKCGSRITLINHCVQGVFRKNFFKIN